jgi:FkbM family methyltransferase
MCQSVLNPRQCYLFEPQPECHARIEVRQRRCQGSWRVVPVALGDCNETHTLHLTRNRAASSLLAPAESGRACVAGIQETGRQTVRVATLDGLVECEKIPAPDLVKLDVQGFEKRVLDGGSATLAKAERMVVEVSLQRLYQDQAPLQDVLQTLTAWGFELDDVSEAYRLWPDIRVCQVDLWLRRSS